MEERAFKCGESRCTKSFKTLHNLKCHLKSVHSQPVLCPYRNCFRVMQPHNLSYHVEVVHEKLKVECPDCGKQMLRFALYKHRKLCKSTGELYQCGIENCDRAFKTLSYRQEHIKNVHNEGEINCPYENCGARFKKTALRAHIELVHQKIMVKCENCGKEVKKRCLTKHKQYCTTTEKKFQCTVSGCVKMFKTKTCLGNHIWLYHRKPVPCPENCGKSYRPVILKEHIELVHQRKNRGTCHYCGLICLKKCLPNHFLYCQKAIEDIPPRFKRGIPGKIHSWSDEEEEDEWNGDADKSDEEDKDSEEFFEYEVVHKAKTLRQFRKQNVDIEGKV